MTQRHSLHAVSSVSSMISLHMTIHGYLDSSSENDIVRSSGTGHITDQPWRAPNRPASEQLVPLRSTDLVTVSKALSSARKAHAHNHSMTCLSYRPGTLSGGDHNRYCNGSSVVKAWA